MSLTWDGNHDREGSPPIPEKPENPRAADEPGVYEEWRDNNGGWWRCSNCEEVIAGQARGRTLCEGCAEMESRDYREHERAHGPGRL